MSQMKLIAALGGALLTSVLMTAAAKADGMPGAQRRYYPAVGQRAPLISWSGFYIGANAGYQWDHTDWTYPNGRTIAQRSESGLFGGHAGIQYQWGRIVAGAEASYSGNLGSGVHSTRTPCPNSALACEARIDTLFTVGPRLGLADDHWLGYVTGGFASASVDNNNVNVATGIAGSPDSARHHGWFIGGGAEYMLEGGWIIGLEYIHTVLDSETHNLGQFGFQKDISADQDILRARISFKLGR